MVVGSVERSACRYRAPPSLYLYASAHSFYQPGKRLRQTVEAAKEQSGDMKESIKQATRAAAAMEEFAKSAERGSKAAAESVVTVRDSMTRQLRAYLCVNFASAGFQNPETKPPL